MVEDSLTTTAHSDKEVEQAIIALKKGAQLLKHRRRGKPKFCPFRLSTDEKFLIWYSGKEQKQLRLDSVTEIILGQKTKQRQPEKECQSLFLVYANGARSLDLICKDKEQAKTWYIGLRTLVSRSHHHRSLCTLRSQRGAQTCANSPVGYIRRKHNLGLLENPKKFSQVRSLCGSPPQSLANRCFSDALSCSSDSFYSSEPRTFSNMQTVMDFVTPHFSSLESDDLKEEEKREVNASSEYRTILPSGVSFPAHGFPPLEKNNVLRDVLMWGEGIEGGNLRGGVDRIAAIPNVTQFDALLPKLLESTALLDVRNISFGGKHAALVTRQGEVLCWGEENRGRLGHKVNMDVYYPKIVESLRGIHVESIACGEYHTSAVTLSGELYTWGDSGLGAGPVIDGSNRCQWLPHKVSGPLDGIYVSSVACGEWHTAVVSSSGQLFTYGDGTFGVLGHGNLQNVFQPKEVESLKGLRVKSVACGPWHTAAIVDIMIDRFRGSTPIGKLFTWGDGDKGRLGHEDRERKLVPTCVAQLVEHDFVQVSCGRMLTVGLTNTGVVCTMGSAVHGQLGNPQAEDKSIAIVEGKLKGEFVKNISSGAYHIAALTSSGRVYTWGKGANGRLGLGDIEDRNSPILVEALRDRQVESVACGSSFTAAICLHKSIFTSDQSACSGCKLVFGFTRKKHNCYNCGFLFCRSCSSKKVINASLAPNKSKSCHVCDTCFIKLTKFTNSNRPIQKENSCQSQASITWKAISDLKIDNREAMLTQGLLFSPKISSHEETKCIGEQTLGKQGRDQLPLDHLSHLSNRPPRWGQVPCPLLFSTSGRENSPILSDPSKNGLSAVSKISARQVLPGSKCMVLSDTSLSRGLPNSEEMLTEEVQRLRSEAKNLEIQCQMRSEKLHQYQQKLEVTWLLAREEADKCKAAKEIIKALTTRLYAMSEKHSAGKAANVVSVSAQGFDVDPPQVTPISTDISALEEDPMNVTIQSSPQFGILKDRQENGLCSPPTPSCNTISHTYERDHCNGSARLADDSLLAKTDSRQNASKTPNQEWVEQDEPGVYITLVALPSGQIGLKRVRFSRKRFSQKEAEHWWEKNQQSVYEKYEIERLIRGSF